MTFSATPIRPYRSLQWITVAYLLLFAIAVALLILSVIHARIIARFESLEKNQASVETLRCRAYLDQKIDVLRRNVWDYAYWSEMAAFFRTQDRKFLDSNIAPTALESLAIDHVWLVSSQGTLLAERQSPSAAYPPPSNTAALATFTQA
ncbi:MAG: CHASE4 domain-containing protein, partial [Verrucomicrobiia bacterium]